MLSLVLLDGLSLTVKGRDLIDLCLGSVEIRKVVGPRDRNHADHDCGFNVIVMVAIILWFIDSCSMESFRRLLRREN